jgi:hypothetical protein
MEGNLELLNSPPVKILLFLLLAATASWAGFVVDSIEIQTQDVFEDAVAHTGIERTFYGFLDIIHIQTQASLVREMLLFDEGDTIDQETLQETERLLRAEKYLSDVRLSHRMEHGQNIVRVGTSDNWTTTIPLSLSKISGGDSSNGEWLYSFGILENNFLGYGISLGAFYAHDEDRDQAYLMYEDGNWIAPHHTLKAILSQNSDGYQRFVRIGYPYLSRLRNQWSYELNLNLERRDQTFYQSGIPNPDPISVVKRMGEDTAHFELSHSFGDELKFYPELTYDYHRVLVREYSDSIPYWNDSRIGLGLRIARWNGCTLTNYHHVKWTEDVDHGWEVRLHASKNSRQIGARNDNWRLAWQVALAFGTPAHNFALKTSNSLYLGTPEWGSEVYRRKKVNNWHKMIYGEYVFKPSDRWATAFEGQFDTWENAPLGRQFHVGGLDGLPGLPSHYFAGQSRIIGRLEERFFPGFEIATVLPVFVVFAAGGHAQDSPGFFDWGGMQYIAGVGLRLAFSKSVDGVVNHIDLSWPVHGPARRGVMPRLSILGKVKL